MRLCGFRWDRVGGLHRLGDEDEARQTLERLAANDETAGSVTVQDVRGGSSCTICLERSCNVLMQVRGRTEGPLVAVDTQMP
jgi:hypothetical protein